MVGMSSVVSGRVFCRFLEGSVVLDSADFLFRVAAVFPCSFWRVVTGLAAGSDDFWREVEPRVTVTLVFFLADRVVERVDRPS